MVITGGSISIVDFNVYATKWDRASRTDIFGEDARVFNPDRWLRENTPSMKGFSNGVFANTYVFESLSLASEKSTITITIHSFTFTGGPRSCIGYRFAFVCSLSFCPRWLMNT
jgi:cytochrome P450